MGVAVKRPNQYSKICTWCRDELKRTGRGFCPLCEKAYPLTDMRDGYCIAHKRAYNRAYRAKNKAREVERVKAWKAAHPQQRPSRWKAYHNPEKDNARARAWHAAHRTQALARQRAYTQARAAENPNYWKERYQREKVRAWRKMRGER